MRNISTRLKSKHR